MAAIARARPLLGTLVEVRADGLDAARATAAVDAAFAEVAAVHRLMSFHVPDSDVSRLNRARAGTPVRVDARTYDVIAAACAFADESDGRFDPTVGARLVEWGLLPPPAGAPPPDPCADWRDVECLGDLRVRLRRAAWIDLGGIAKGHAVDRALAALRAAGARAASVNAGGDLARYGECEERIALRHGDGLAAPALDLGDAALATSVAARRRGPHVDMRRRAALRSRRAVSVVADRCMTADALTKIVLADVRGSARLLRRHHAIACVQDVRLGLRLLGEA